MKTIASIASLDGEFTNSSGRKTFIQTRREEFDPLLRANRSRQPGFNFQLQP